MTSIKELQARIEQANKLLSQDILPSHERLRVASLRLLDQKAITLRQKHPELDVPDNPEPASESEPENM